MDIVPKSYEDTLAALAAHADAHGDDWRVKVFRRASPTAPLDYVAILDDARVEHFTNAETWLPQLSGGGPHYVLQAVHAKKPQVIFAHVVPPMISGPPRPLDARAPDAPGWLGPRTLVAPLPPQAEAPGGILARLAGGTSSGTPRRSGDDPSGGAAGLFDPIFEDLRKRERELEDRTRRAELEAVKREADERARRLEARIEESMRRPQADATSTIATVIGALTPLVKGLMDSAAEQRRMLLELEMKRLEREGQRPAIDPQIMALIHDVKGQAELQSKSIGAMIEMQASAGRTMMQTVATAIEMMGPRGDDHPWISALEKGIEAFTALVQSQGAQRPALPGQPPPQLGPRLNGGARPAGPPVAPPQPQPPPPAVRVAPEPPDPRLAEPEPESAIGQEETEGESEGSLLDQIEEAIRDHDPQPEIVEALLEAFRDPESKAEIVRAGGLVQLVQARLGAWIGEGQNLAYVQGLLAQLQTEAARRGGIAGAPVQG